jgi:putative acetyltransferase
VNERSDPGVVIAVDDPRRNDVRTLIETHLAFSQAVTPSAHVHALPVDGLVETSVTFFSARRGGILVGVGALKELDAGHAELKSMHTSAAVRGQGIGRAMVDHLISVAVARGYRRVSLETGAGEAFAAARALYAAAGFTRCAPFAGYTDNPYSTCMTIEVV